MSNQTHIRFDWAVKKLLRSKANFGILEGFLSELLNENIKIQEIIESESNRETEDDKSNRVDIMVKDSKGELIIVEIQNTRELDYFYKVLYNTSKAIAENIAKGDSYWKVKKVITVSVVYFDLGQGLDYVYHGDTRFIGIHQKDVLELSEAQKRMFNKPSVTSIFPDHYIIKVNEFNDTARDSLDEWIYFFKNSEIKKEFKAQGLAEAREKLKEINLRGKELAAYKRYLEQLRYESSIADTIKFEERFAREKAHEEGLNQGIEEGIEKGIEKGIEQGIEQGIKQGIEKGREQGEKNKALEIARKLKEKGVDIDMICETSGLSKEVVKNL